MKDPYKQKIGKWGESVAAEYLSGQGCSIAARNVRTSEGEIDLVVDLNGEVRFVEVKSRTSRRYGYPEESITPAKYEHMAAAAEKYSSSMEPSINEWHLDVVAIYGKPGMGSPEIEWFKDVEVE